MHCGNRLTTTMQSYEFLYEGRIASPQKKFPLVSGIFNCTIFPYSSIPFITFFV